jgi:putative transposase
MVPKTTCIWVVRIPGSISLGEIAKKTKGPTSRMVNVNFPEEAGFYWQEGYGVFSISPWDLERVIEYVRNQKAHHANGTTIPDWEETDTAWP